MKKLNTNGFSPILLLLLFVIVGLLAGMGYYVYNSQNVAGTDLDSTGNSRGEQQNREMEEQTTLKKIDETANWAVFMPNSKLYTLKLPDGWLMMHQNDECDCLLTKSMIYKKGVPAVIETTQGGRDSGSGFFVAVDDKDKTDQRFVSAWQKKGTVKVGDLDAKTYYYEQTIEEEGIGLPKGGKEYAYYIPKNGKYIYISYSVYPGQDNQIDLVEQTIQTLR